MSVVLLDTGPLVAYLDAAQASHEWTVEQFATLSEPVVTCEAVITEACFLLRRRKEALQKIADYLRDGIIRLDFALSERHERVFDLMRCYHNVPMSVADACLVCMAEEKRGSRVFTLDSDFSIYRLHGRTAPLVIRPKR